MRRDIGGVAADGRGVAAKGVRMHEGVGSDDGAAVDLGVLDADVLAVAVQTVDALIVVTDPNGLIVAFNPACERLTGRSAEEMIGVNAVALLATGGRTDLIEASVELLERGGSRRSVGRWVTRDGEERTVAFTTTVLGHPDGTPRCLVVTGVDITGEQRALLALSESERRHRALVEHSADIVAVVDVAGLITYVSPSAERILGWNPAEVEGRPALDVGAEDDREAVRRR